MREIIDADMPFLHKTVRTVDAAVLFRERGMNDKARLIETAGMPYTSYYELDGYILSLIHILKVQEGVSMRCDLNALPDKILHTDPKRVTQVVSNLLSNAIKFTEQGAITLSYRVEEDHVLFEVSDTGIGISARHIETIFERFTKVDSFKQGTGLDVYKRQGIRGVLSFRLIYWL